MVVTFDKFRDNTLDVIEGIIVIRKICVFDRVNANFRIICKEEKRVVEPILPLHDFQDSGVVCRLMQHHRVYT